MRDTSSVVLEPGDVVRIAVYGRPDLTGDFPIAEGGYITHPLLRAVQAAGVPMPQLEQRVRTFLKTSMAEPAFVLTPLLHVFVGGEVKAPGNYVAPVGTTLDQAILLGGGVTENGRRDQIELVRNRERSTLD